MPVTRTKRALGIGLAALTASAGLISTPGQASADAAPCTDIDFVVARGTFEPGTLGVIVGDPVNSALKSTLTGRSVSAYPVNYPANLDADSPTKGNTDMVNHVTSQAAACPGQRFVLAGYSQGAAVLNRSIGIGTGSVATIPASLQSRVTAVLFFGNPLRGQGTSGPYGSRIKDFCQDGDPVCNNGNNFLAHLLYFRNAQEAADYVKSKL
ncbi:cutinase family protein [Spirillospora sp. NPDC048911]|uniref:cutinase family protein n=1 Tax=Spirillospora sp. NPDC048911 TaxID=3364527 RepID=UPI00371293E5